VLRWLADENFNNDIVRALLRRKPAFDVVRAQDVGLTGIDDGALLAWAEMINLELHHMPPPPIRRDWRIGAIGSGFIMRDVAWLDPGKDTSAASLKESQ
jgi:Domain of unknown function (DUF5615)